MNSKFPCLAGNAMVFACAALAWSPGAPAALPSRGEVVSTAADQTGVAVTIYNDDLALVRDARRVRLERDLNRLAWREVSAQIRPETALLRTRAATAGFRVLEQNFDFDLLTPAKLLEKYVGRDVAVIRTHPTTGAESRETATVLAAGAGVVLRFADRIETGVPGRLAFSAVPDTMRDRPTLVITAASTATGVHDLELSYLTAGLSWRADYVAALDPDDSRLDLNGWVTLTNRSGATYPEARLQLVAGDVNRVRDGRPATREVMAMAARAAGAPELQQETLFEYHLYTLQRPTTLADNQTKQVALMSASRVPVRKQLLLEGAHYYYSAPHADLGQKLRAGVFIEFDNKGEGLGVPLPRGIIRFYKQDSRGSAQFVGEDRIEHTPKNETIRVKLGEAFDVTADRTQTDFKKLAGTSRYNYVFESAYAIVLKNAKQEAVTVSVREPLPGDWEMVSESQPHAKGSAGTAEWQVRVPAEGQAKLTYRVRVRY